MKAIVKNPLETTAKVILTGIFEDKKELSNTQLELDKKYQNCLTNNILPNFDGKFKESLTYPASDGTKIVAVGLGKYEELTLTKLRETISKNIAANAEKDGIMAITLPEKSELCKKCLTASTYLGVGLGEYKYDKYKKADKRIKTLEILTVDTDSAINEGIDKATVLNNAMTFVKDMVFEPAQNMTPSKVAEIAQEMGKTYGLDVEIYNKDQLKEMNFNAFLAVGQGSAQEPKFIHITYKPENPRKKVALIGKGITFDSGGLDIKPPSSMLTMKTDMTGAATALGVMKAIAELKPDIELHVMTALCENMPSGSSYKVGDVLVSKSGKTIEVDNTDAEGRLTLADVLTYADEINPDEVIDIATLTGAVIVALGPNITGILGNNQNMIDEFKACADKMGENVWQMPMFDDMAEGLKSDIADMKNTGPRGAGCSVAGRFLSNFTKSKNWLHIDIAGTAYIDKPYRELQKGATAVMLRTLVSYITK